MQSTYPARKRLSSSTRWIGRRRCTRQLRKTQEVDQAETAAHPLTVPPASNGRHLNDAAPTRRRRRADRIIVATQVVEAGVDISSRTLITELAPWASIVQRIGRCNRTGDDGPGQVFWIDLDEKQSLPYSVERPRLRPRSSWRNSKARTSRRRRSTISSERTRNRSSLLPFEHKHVLRRRDLLDLFDTTPDLSGNDIDIQRFVRGDDPDTDVQVFWRDFPTVADPRRTVTTAAMNCAACRSVKPAVSWRPWPRRNAEPDTSGTTLTAVDDARPEADSAGVDDPAAGTGRWV